METADTRTIGVIGTEPFLRLQKSHVLVFGIGGVGGYCAEALVRSGIGELTIVDHDCVSVSNLNRQLIALHSTLGEKKVDVMSRRLKDIRPDLKIHAVDAFYLPDHGMDPLFDKVDYIVDAIDTITAKLDLVEKAKQYQIPLISCMGTGNKMDPSQLKVADIYATHTCPLCRVMRHELRKRNIDRLKVVFSEETPHKAVSDMGRTPGSLIFVPGSAGLLLASEVVWDLMKKS